MPDVSATSLPFDEAIQFFRAKENIATSDWLDLDKKMHAVAFAVAGAMRDDLLADLKGAVDQAIADGTTQADFDKAFQSIVAKYGWSHTGSAAWRSKVIYETNLRTAYAAGRYKQMTDPEVAKARPYWIYRHSHISLHPRLAHLAWDGLVLAADDPWWKTHYPPNGWGCNCYVETLSRRDLARLGKTGPDKAPPVELVAKTVRGVGRTATIETPVGIDPGWGYNVGEAAWGSSQQAVLMETHGPWVGLRAPAAVKGAQPPFETLVPSASFEPQSGVSASDPQAYRQAFMRAVGDASTAPDDAVDIADPTGESVRLTVAVPDHFLEDGTGQGKGRSPFFGLVRPTIEDPEEIWLGFAESAVSGRVTIRRRYVKLFRDAAAGKDRAFGVIADVDKGLLSGLESDAPGWRGATAYPNDATRMDSLRGGYLIYRRADGIHGPDAAPARGQS